jgi:hypothetical protein
MHTLDVRMRVPDDVVGAVVAFMPPSGFLEFVWCSRRLSKVLRAQLQRRLDHLFVVMQPGGRFVRGLLQLPLTNQLLRCELKSLFGEAYGIWDLQTSGHSFVVEAPKGYDGPSRMLQLYRRSATHHGQTICGPYFVGSPWMPATRRFSAWLQRRRELYLISENERVFACRKSA